MNISPSLKKSIDDELTWREREMILARVNLFRSSGSDIEFRYAYRSFISLTYAHYEAYVKQVVAQALDDVRASGLLPSRCASLMKSVLFGPIVRKRVSQLRNDEIVGHIESGADYIDTLPYPPEEVILECGNMNLGNFEFTISAIGLDPSRFSGYRGIIGRITSLRHVCAHGEKISLDPLKTNHEIADDAYELQRRVVELMHELSVAVIDHIVADEYKI